MKTLFSLRARWLWAAAAGAMLALAQPKFEIAGFAWVAPAILLLATFGAAPKEAFRIGYIGGFVQQVISLNWLLFIPFPVGAVVGWIALSAFLALYPALWCVIAWKLFPLPVRGLLFEPTPTDRFTETNLFQRLKWGLLCAAAWVAMEMTQARFLSGFPWNFLGTSQFRMLPLIQIGEFTSVYGVSFVMVWFACSLFSAGMILTRRKNQRFILEIMAVGAVIVLMMAYGFARVMAPSKYKADPNQRTIKVALVQPSIPQTLIFDSKENTNRFRELVRLSEKALQTKPDLLVWPEAAVPTMLRHDPATAGAVRDLVTNYNVCAILGTDDAMPRNRINPDADKIDYYNAAFAINPRGEMIGSYRKRLLVIFGEFVPFTEWLPFMKYLSPVGEDSFQRGEGPVPFYFDELKMTTSVLICFEDTFPHFARDYVKEDTDFLLNLTNNGWFGESAAQWQHAATALFRAIENRIPLVRCSNNGLTCWIDEVGGMHEVYTGDSKDIYGPGFKTAEVPLLPEGGKRRLTFYTRHGDVFGWICVGLTLMALTIRIRGSVRVTRGGRL